jgi:hypothetical protein
MVQLDLRRIDIVKKDWKASIEMDRFDSMLCNKSKKEIKYEGTNTLTRTVSSEVRNYHGVFDEGFNKASFLLRACRYLSVYYYHSGDSHVVEI